VIGAVERGGKVTAKATAKEKMKGRHMRAFVRERVDVIKHQEWYVDGDIHTKASGHF